MKKRLLLCAVLSCMITFWSCQDEPEVEVLTPPENSEMSGNTYQMIEIPLDKYYQGRANISWKIIESPSDLFRISDIEPNKALFVGATEGKYVIEVSTNSEDKSQIELTLSATSPSAYIARVFEYLPAPGQFVNKLPKYEEGDTAEDMAKKAEDEIAGEETTMITLGGWGGYVTIGFDHTIPNVEGKCDFRILGNAFAAAANPKPNAPFGGSCEAGIIMVAYDKNKNGEPDEDEWFEVKGSGNFGAENEPWFAMQKAVNGDTRTFRNYEMTYHKPTAETAEEAAEPNNPNKFASIYKYIKWTDNQGQEGYKIKNVYHKQSYYPLWINEDIITYKGIRLADNGIDESGKGSYYVLYAFNYGYVDNYANKHDKSGIDIDWAITKDGKPANLAGIDFVKVYNGVDKENGWLGEASTEILGGYDLHLMEEDINSNFDN